MYVEEDLIDIVAEYLKLDPIERPAFVRARKEELAIAVKVSRRHILTLSDC